MSRDLFDEFRNFFFRELLTNFVDLFYRGHLTNLAIFFQDHLPKYPGLFFLNRLACIKNAFADGVKSTVFAYLPVTFIKDENFALFFSHFSLFFLRFSLISLFFKSDSPPLGLKSSMFQNFIF